MRSEIEQAVQLLQREDWEDTMQEVLRRTRTVPERSPVISATSSLHIAQHQNNAVLWRQPLNGVSQPSRFLTPNGS